MSTSLVDLNNCNIEPIHIPGQIQSHGFLIVIDQNQIIRFYSENIYSYLKLPGITLLGQPIGLIEPIIGKNEPPNFINQLIVFGRTNGFDQTNPFQTDIQGLAFHLIISQSENYFLLEFEPSQSDLSLDIQKMVGRSISEMLADKNLQNLLNNTAMQIKSIINYDRVMIYKFAEDGHGEVVAEARNNNLESWLGLHYPASDIPQQARELYKVNLTRLIADVHTEPSKILAEEANAEKHLDLSYSQLRAVSPIHIQYLKNMGVCSSFSISLIYHKELWGLIACHNYTPRFINYKSRESAKLIGQILSSALEFRQDEENQSIYDKYKASVTELSRYMLQSMSIEDALTAHSITLMDVADVSGAVLVYENNITKLGKTPGDEQLNSLISWVDETISEPIYYTQHLSQLYPDAEAYKKIASGMFVCTISKELNEYVIWFKPEQLQTIQWAGNPEKPAEINIKDGLLTVSPRKSFDNWAETVVGTSKLWGNAEIKSILRLKGEITYAINQKASEIRILNEKLKQAYEELDTFSFTISHDLKNPLTTIKSYSQILMRDKNMSPESLKILNRIDASTDKMDQMIREVLEYSRIGKTTLTKVPVDIQTLVEDQVRDLSVAYQTQDLEMTIGDTPVLQGDPVMISQVFSNLLSNAIKYSSHSNPSKVSVNGILTDTEVIYSIADNGIGIDIKQLPSVFELFKRMDNAKDIEGTGVGLAIVKRIVEKHQGKVWVDSELGRGSTFYLAFQR
jgi:light-regulated signal transduction histidine kinase (bacteriophytochrome)